MHYYGLTLHHYHPFHSLFEWLISPEQLAIQANYLPFTPSTQSSVFPTNFTYLIISSHLIFLPFLLRPPKRLTCLSSSSPTYIGHTPPKYILMNSPLFLSFPLSLSHLLLSESKVMPRLKLGQERPVRFCKVHSQGLSLLPSASIHQPFLPYLSSIVRLIFAKQPTSSLFFLPYPPHLAASLSSPNISQDLS